MANKYIIHGAAYCGDGTASNEAASAGAVGAWNDINVFTGTAPSYGVLAAGDVVYIRSKSSDGSDITVTYSGGATYYFGSSVATTWDAPISWVIDNGSVWAGIDGIVKFTLSSTVFAYSFRNYNVIIARTQSALVVEATGDGCSWGKAFWLSGDLSGIKLRMPNKVSSGNGDIVLNNVRAQNLAIDYGRFIPAGTFGPAAASFNVLTNTMINALYATPQGISVFGQQSDANSESSKTIVIGGSLSGVGATSGLSMLYLTNRGHCYEFIGFKFPSTVAAILGTPHIGNSAQFFGADGGSGAVVIENWGTIDSRSDGYYPCLNATYPKSTLEKWSWKVVPNNVRNTAPARVVSSKLYTAPAAAKTITANFLISTSMNPTLENVYIDLSYVDAATSTVKTMTSRALSGSLSSSSAAWTAETYGPIAFNKYEIALTTPTSIKQDTLVTVTFMTHLKSLSSNDIMFFDPDIVLS